MMWHGRRRVDRVEQRRHARGLTGTGGSGEEHEPALQVRELANGVGKTDVVEARDDRLHETQRDRRKAPLEEDVASEPVGPVGEREVEVTVDPELLEVLGIDQIAQELRHHVVGDDRKLGNGPDRSVEAHERRRPDRQHEIGALHVHYRAQSRVESCVNFHIRR